VFAVNVDGAPTIVAPDDIHVVVARVSVAITTYLAPFKFELDAGRVIANDAPAVPVKYVFVFIIVKDVNVLLVTM
jgi:hypothetical protein